VAEAKQRLFSALLRARPGSPISSFFVLGAKKPVILGQKYQYTAYCRSVARLSFYVSWNRPGPNLLFIKTIF
jgi:hypothetical protein